jgi:hypothetical protein
MDTDHVYFPRRNYRTSVERRFRELEDNKREICMALHAERHALITERVDPLPEKPTREQMNQAVNQRSAQ